MHSRAALELALSQSPAELPIKSHSERLASGARGVSLAFLQGMRDFFEARGALGMGMEDVCNSGTCDFTVCALTAHTGLSLAESIALVGSKERVTTDDLVGKATTFFSCPHDGTTLGEAIASGPSPPRRPPSSAAPPRAPSHSS